MYLITWWVHMEAEYQKRFNDLQEAVEFGRKLKADPKNRDVEIWEQHWKEL